MPLMMNGGRVPARWAEKKNMSPRGAREHYGSSAECLKISLVNNMPDAALEDTELQFFELLDAASGDVPVLIKLYSAPEIVRSDRAQLHLSSHYFGIGDLLNSQCDGVMITGTEPRQRNLRDEPYWRTMVDVFDWAESNTSSAVLSCLAAHASVLHSDAIDRTPLADKQFGVFDYQKSCEHPLTNGATAVVRFPHSRWNEVREEALTAHGYSILTKSPEAGVDLFVKQKKHSLFVHFQGHPEYFSRTLLKEYRRDIRRFLTRERETYPTRPHGYFDPEAVKLLDEFRKNAEIHRQEDLMDVFPETAVGDTLQNTWRESALCIYRNWLQVLMSRKSGVSPIPAAVRAGTR
jgi:homoserine O-succinyltransferase/O-acetyltransferase